MNPLTLNVLTEAGEAYLASLPTDELHERLRILNTLPVVPGSDLAHARARVARILAERGEPCSA